MPLTLDQRQFAAAFAQAVLGREIETASLPEDLSAQVFYELSRQEELACPQRDLWGNWEWTFADAQRRGDLYRPYLDIAIRRWADGHGIDCPKPQWPDGKAFALCLTHDVDFISRRATSIGYIGELVRRFVRVPWGGKRSAACQIVRHVAKLLAGPLLRRFRADEYHAFDTCLDLEAAHGFTSTFFFFAHTLPAPHPWDCGYSHRDTLRFFGRTTTVGEMMGEMLRLGWDVGLHGSYRSATDLAALIEEKRQVEQSAGAPIQSVRHHYLHYDARTTPGVHQQAGIKADSTQGFNRNIGFRAGTAFPYYCWDHQEQRATSVLEIPLHVMDGPLFATSGLEYGVEQAIEHVRALLDRVEDVGGCLTLNWHPSWLSRPAFAHVYASVLEEAHRRNAWGCSVSELVRHWASEAFQNGAGRRPASAIAQAGRIPGACRS